MLSPTEVEGSHPPRNDCKRRESVGFPMGSPLSLGELLKVVNAVLQALFSSLKQGVWDRSLRSSLE